MRSFAFRPLLFVLTSLLLVAAPAVSVSADSLTDGEFKDLAREARKLMKQTGTLAGKQRLIVNLGADDSVRGSEVLVTWMRQSLKFQAGPLADELAERKSDFDRTVKILSKAYETIPPIVKKSDGTRVIQWKSTDHKNAYESTKKPFDKALFQYGVEEDVQFAISNALETVRDEAAVRWLMVDGLKTLRKAKPPELAQSAIVRCLAHQPTELVSEVLLGFASNTKIPRARIIALTWIGDRQVEAGFGAARAGLQAKEIAVQRAAVEALVNLSDPHAVKPLIDALAKASGVLGVEISDALHHYVGISMQGSHSAWMMWWKNEGEAWVAANDRARHGPKERHRKDDAYGFYGIETESKRIVFVLDRSGSMNTPADPESKKTRPDDPGKPPVVTGPGEKPGGDKGKEPPPVVAGDTKIEVAKNQLAWSLKQLPKDVLFGVVFYSTDVDVWQTPPTLLAATGANKKKAIKWLEPIEADGSTTLFDALMKALEYANTLEGKPNERNNGADTIFLLTDGSPTDKMDGKRILTSEEIDAAIKKFHEANEVYKCTVHCVGIGKSHNSPLLRRIASETGGTYRRAGE